MRALPCLSSITPLPCFLIMLLPFLPAPSLVIALAGHCRMPTSAAGQTDIWAMQGDIWGDAWRRHPACRALRGAFLSLAWHRTGRMTEEQRAAKLAEMAGNASVHEEARWVRQKRAREADAAEEDANAAQPTGFG